MTNLTALVGEIEAMQERLRSKLRRHDLESGGGIVSVDGSKSKFWTNGEVWQTRNPDGPAAADAIDKAIATLKAQREALEPFARFALEGKRGGKFIICKALFDDMKTWDESPPRSAHLHEDDFRRARASIEGNPTA